MTRCIRTFLIFSIILISGSSRGYAKDKPNVIFIIADDLGYGDIGAYGQKLIKTPHIDALAKQGIRFTQFYAGSSVCAPSRSSLMTGQHTGHTPIRGNKEVLPEGQFPLQASAYTIAELFKDAGYATGNFGKWGLGFIGTEGDPNKQGFTQFYGYNCQRLAHDYFPDHLWDNHIRVALPNTLTVSEIYAPDLIQRKALEFLETHKNRPFFAFLSYTLPHAGLELPENDSLFSHYRKIFNEVPKTVETVKTEPSLYKGQPYPHAAYAAMVTRLDNYVGEVVAKLKKLRIEKNTVIVFTSDNGPHVEGGNDPQFFNSAAGFRGVKRDLYEGGIRVPMIVSWPAVIKKARISGYIGAFWDFMPTFSEMTGKPTPRNLDGLSILPEIKGKGKQPGHEYLYWEFHENGGRQAVRMGRWKGVKLNARTNFDSSVELYDLDNDIAEVKNIAAAHPDIVKRISEIMKDARVENADYPFMSNVNRP
ncbi:arylsulfatase [Daejeonella lutea]|uniref:Arylsulfatase A n=1 Tax=Daejeonella lutea TaxID=572036 RepID=A0A1T5AVX6_9SPHI|nr:arylsulfatase [Daejeonella lutea]SKB39191.1 Arylsulfatase A [Daejeonella lutea]